MNIPFLSTNVFVFIFIYSYTASTPTQPSSSQITHTCLQAPLVVAEAQAIVNNVPQRPESGHLAVHTDSR